jgi:hypothetical protein
MKAEGEENEKMGKLLKRMKARLGNDTPLPQEQNTMTLTEQF